MEIEVKEFNAPKIVINYEQLKAELEKNLEEYKGLVVTEETLKGSKAAQKELASLRVKIDTYRKEKKKEVEKPIKAFESQCKELIALVDAVEKPIKDGIKVFDDQKREEKRQKAAEIAQEVAAETGLNEKYAEMLTVLDKYTNLTAKVSDVKEDLETRAFALKVEQDREADRIKIIESVIESENERLSTKITIDMYKRDIEAGTETSVIIQDIKSRANMIYEAENKPKEQPKEEEPKEVPTQPQQAEETENKQLYKVEFEVVGTLEEQRAVSRFLKENGINYTVNKQVEV